MEIALAIYLSYLLGKLASRKGEKPKKWILRFLFMWFFGSLMYYSMWVSKMGVSFFESSLFLQMLPIKLGIDFLLFAYYRASLMRMKDISLSENDAPPQKKDLSYFR